MIAVFTIVVRARFRMEDCVEEAMGNRITLRQAMLKILKQAESTEDAVDSHLPQNNGDRINTNSSAHVSDSRGGPIKGTIRWSNVLNHMLFRSNKHRRYIMMKLK